MPEAASLTSYHHQSCHERTGSITDTDVTFTATKEEAHAKSCKLRPELVFLVLPFYIDRSILHSVLDSQSHLTLVLIQSCGLIKTRIKFSKFEQETAVSSTLMSDRSVSTDRSPSLCRAPNSALICRAAELQRSSFNLVEHVTANVTEGGCLRAKLLHRTDLLLTFQQPDCSLQTNVTVQKEKKNFIAVRTKKKKDKTETRQLRWEATTSMWI